MRRDGENGVAVDPLCGQPVLVEDARSLARDGRVWHFCSDDCRRRFVARAERARLAEAARRGALFARDERVRWGVA